MMHRALILLFVATLLAPGASGAAKMVYACTTDQGRTTIQDRPCSGGEQRSYATPDGGSRASPPSAPASGPARPQARLRNVDFSVACRSLDEERVAVLAAVQDSRDERETGRLQARLKRIHQAQCTAHCGGC